MKDHIPSSLTALSSRWQGQCIRVCRLCGRHMQRLAQGPERYQHLNQSGTDGQQLGLWTRALPDTEYVLLVRVAIPHHLTDDEQAAETLERSRTSSA